MDSLNQGLQHTWLYPEPRFFSPILISDERCGGWDYIMADRYRGTLYVGVTAHLAARVNKHRNGNG